MTSKTRNKPNFSQTNYEPLRLKGKYNTLVPMKDQMFNALKKGDVRNMVAEISHEEIFQT